jgi:hypothetical protein
MNQRERFLAYVLLGTIIVVAIGGMAYLFVLKPLKEINGQVENTSKDIATQTRALQQEKEKQKQLLALDPRMGQWKSISLPTAKGTTPLDIRKHQDALQVEYEKFLSELLRSSGFDMGSVTVTSKGYNSATRQNIPKLANKKPLYEVLSFTVTGPAEFRAIVAMQQKFYEARVLHSIRNFSISTPKTTRQGSSRGALDVSMAVDVLMVAGSEQRDTLFVARDKEVSAEPEAEKEEFVVLAPSERNYQQILSKNMFTGVPVRNREARMTEDPREVLAAVKLTHIEEIERRWKARFYDQAKGGDETVVIGGLLNEFTIRDRYNSEVLKGEVIHISNTLEIYFWWSDQTQLFTIDAPEPEDVAGLDKRTLTEGIYAQFETSGQALSWGARVNVKTGGSYWEVLDQGRRYAVRSAGRDGPITVSEEKCYRMRLGDFLSDALAQPLQVVQMSDRYLLYRDPLGFTCIEVNQRRPYEPGRFILESSQQPTQFVHFSHNSLVFQDKDGFMAVEKADGLLEVSKTRRLANVNLVGGFAALVADPRQSRPPRDIRGGRVNR